MRGKSVVLIVIALGCGLVASIGISQVMERGSGEQAVVETVPIYVAIADIDINEELKPTDVRVEEWPKDKVPEGCVREVDELEGQFASARLYAGEPITRRKIADSITTTSIKIPHGFRVCSFKVRMDTAVSFLIQPGDRVDIIATFRRGRDVSQTVTTPILRNVRLFAINSETEKELGQDGQPIVAKTVSVLVKKEQVEPLMMADELASLRLSLRSPGELADDETDANVKITLDELLSGRAEVADTPVEDQQGNGSFGRGFVDFLSGMKQPQVDATPQPAAPLASAAPEWELTILTADGRRNFVWHDSQGMPEEVDGRAAVQPAFPSVPSTAPAYPATGVPAGTTGPGGVSVEPNSSNVDVDTTNAGAGIPDLNEPNEAEAQPAFDD